jgi:MraZ protein
VELDPQGRIRVPADLARQAALESEVILIGLGDRVELWNRMRWEAYFSQIQPRFDELAETTFRDRPPTVAAVPSHDGTRPTQPR